MPIKIPTEDLITFDALEIEKTFCFVNDLQIPDTKIVKDGDPIGVKVGSILYRVIAGSPDKESILFIDSGTLIAPLEPYLSDYPDWARGLVSLVDPSIVQTFGDLNNNKDFIDISNLGPNKFALQNAPVLQKKDDIEYQVKGMNERFFMHPDTPVVEVNDLEGVLVP